MKAEMYYRETTPKELRIYFENDDEIKFFKLLFSLTPSGILDRFTKDELDDEDITESWKKSYIKKEKAKYIGEIHEYPLIEGGMVNAPVTALINHTLS